MNDRVDLFVRCFGDTEDMAKAFFDCVGVTTLSEYVDDRLASMASLIRINGDNANGFYVYGVCVDESFRGRGMFKQIMTSCENYAKRENADFVCLIPANERLFDTYFRMGYTQKIAPYNPENIGNLYICSADFKKFATPESNGSANNGICGLAKILRNDFSFEFEPAFSYFMGDI